MLQMVDFEVNNLEDRTSMVDNGGKMLSCMLPQSPFWARKVPSSDAEPVSESFRTRFTVPQESFWLLETGLAKPSFLIDVSSGLPALALPARVVLVHGRRLCTVFMVKERGDACDALVGGCDSVLGPH